MVVAGKTQKTKTVKDSVDPTWEEKLTFDRKDGNDVLLQVYDDNMLRDELLGQVTVPLSRAPFEDWVELKDKNNGNAGYVLVRIDDGKDHDLPSAGPPPAAPVRAYVPAISCTPMTL